MEKEEVAQILSKLALSTPFDLILDQLEPHAIQSLLFQTLFSKTNNINNKYRLNILCSIIYFYYIKVEWKRHIIHIIDNTKWLQFNYVNKLNVCFEYIPECKKEIIEIYQTLIKQKRINDHRYSTLSTNNTFNTCCCGSLDCSIVQLFDNITKFEFV